jgi:hypothetical protein
MIAFTFGMSLFGQVHTANILKLVPAFSCHKFYHCPGARMFFLLLLKGTEYFVVLFTHIERKGKKN